MMLQYMALASYIYGHNFSFWLNDHINRVNILCYVAYIFDF